MIWLDSLLAVPGVGIRIIPDYKEIFEFQKRLAYFVDFVGKQEGFEIDKLEIQPKEVWGYSVSVPKTGFSFVVTPNNIGGQFMYHIEQIRRPGALPTYELPKTLPYTKLLEKLFNLLENILLSVRDLRGFKFDRIGIVAKVGSNQETLPPGVLKLIEHLIKPWGKLTSVESALSARIFEDKDAKYYDGCHHILNFDDKTPENGIKFILDWQRNFKEHVSVSEGKGIFAALSICRDSALEYFQKFGEGDLNYG